MKLKSILTIIFVFYFSNLIFSQVGKIDGYVVAYDNDTIRGKFKDKKYFSSSIIKIFQNDKKLSFSKDEILSFKVGNDLYIKSDINEWGQAFYLKLNDKEVNTYKLRNRYFLGKYDSDINRSNIVSSTRFYCDDYPKFDSISEKLNRNNAIDFVSKYNDWKASNTESKSFYEKKMHHKKQIMVKTGFLMPGIGAEFKISNSFSFQSMFRNGWLVSITNSGTEALIFPIIDNQFRYYFDYKARVLENKKTYNFNGNYFALTHKYDFTYSNTNFGVFYGWQRTHSKYWYTNIGVGGGYNVTSAEFFILYDVDFGLNF